MAKSTTKQKIEKIITKKSKDVPEVPKAPPVVVPVVEDKAIQDVLPLEVPPTILEYQIVEEPVNSAAVFKKEDIVEINDDAVVELIPKFAEAEIKRSKEENNAEHIQIQIKKLRVKLENGTISDGEAAELFNLLSEQ